MNIHSPTFRATSGALPDAGPGQHASHFHVEAAAAARSTQPAPASAVNAQADMRAAAGARHIVSEALAQECATLDDDAPMTELAQGKRSTVYRTVVTLPNGSAFAGAYKQPGKAKLCLRNLAAYRIDQKLGLNVIARTHLVLSEGGTKLDIIMEEAVGCSPEATGDKHVEVTEAAAVVLRDHPKELYEFAVAHGFKGVEIEDNVVTLENPGRHAYYFNAVDCSDSDTRRELTKLRWLDILTLESDRHERNYFVGRDAQHRLRVTGTDNDFAFAIDAVHDTPCPQVIDEATAHSLLALRRQGLEEACGGLISTGQIDAMERRLLKIQAAIAAFSPGQVVPRNASWSTARVSALLGIDESFAAWDDPAQVRGFLADAAAGWNYVTRIFSQQEVTRNCVHGPIYRDGELEELARTLAATAGSAAAVASLGSSGNA